MYQGEDPDALNNVKIGEFRVEGLLDVASGNVITLTLGLDLNGILQVSAQEKDTGMEKSITIKMPYPSLKVHHYNLRSNVLTLY